MDQLSEALQDGVPSLKECSALQVEGSVKFSSENVFRGRVSVSNASTGDAIALPPGTYTDQNVAL